MSDLWRQEAPGTVDGDLVVVLVHGSMDRSASFAKVARRLDAWTTVRYDRRGYGRSLDLGAATSFTQQVDDLFEVLAGRAAVVAGHSLGGVIALAAAVRDPALVQAVLAYEAPMAWQDWWPSQSAGAQAIAVAEDPAAAGDAAERFMRGIVGDDTWVRLPPSTRAQRRAEGVALVADLRSIRDPSRPPYDPSDLRIPVVAAHGSESVVHHVESARQLAASTGGHARVIGGAGHGAHRSHPEEFAALVSETIALVRG